MAGLFILQANGDLTEMTEQHYESEDLLQDLLARYPNLLVGDQVNRAAPRRWLFVKREMEVPSTEGGGWRWSIDHLFLDQDGIPTFVETKRGENRELRREVVGQMLEYASNAVVYWPADRIRDRFEETCRLSGHDPDERLAQILESDGEVDAFWQLVQTNLTAGRVRLVFVSDVIPSELRRIVEFLNKQMSPAEVLAVEIRQYVGQGLKALVPAVIGMTEEAQIKKSPAVRPQGPGSAEPFLEAIAGRSEAEAAAARKIIEWSTTRGLRPDWGRARMGSFQPTLADKGQSLRLFYLYGTGAVQLNFVGLSSRSPFGDDKLRQELLDRLTGSSDLQLSLSEITGYPSVRLDLLTNQTVLDAFLGTFDWVVDQIRAH